MTVCQTAEGTLALWGEVVEKLGPSMLHVQNSYALTDELCALPENGFGMQSIRLTHVFWPAKAEADGGLIEVAGEAGAPLTFGDLAMDMLGLQAAVEAAVVANVRVGGVQEKEHYTKAAALFRTLPGLAERKVEMLAELTLRLQYFAE